LSASTVKEVARRRWGGLLVRPLASRPDRDDGRGAVLSSTEDWEDRGHQYIWSEEAVRVLTRLGVQNWHAVITKVDADYQRERRKGTVRDPERLARTMVLNAGRSAMRAGSIQHKGRRRPILRAPIERHDPVTGRTHSIIEEQVRFQAKAVDEARDELRSRLQREDEQADHRAQLRQMRRRLGTRMLGRPDLSCPLHERTCPQAAKVLAAALGMVTFLGNALDEQESGEWEQIERRRRAHRTQSPIEWDQRLQQRLIHLAAEAAHTQDPVMYDNSQRGRQARARVARCVLHTVWFEAKAADFKYFAEQARVTLEWVYAQRLRRQGISEPARERLLSWFQDHGESPFDPEGDLA
jgi:hypothetical protein